MKKNTMMRLASALLVLVLLTTCAISGTFAKYVSSADAEASARVAYWGWATDAEIEFSLFDYTDANVVSSNVDKIVAPGTENEVTFAFAYVPTTDGKALNAGAIAAPEVAYTFAVEFSAEGSDTDALDANPNFYWTLDGKEYQTVAKLKEAVLLLSGDASGSKEYAAGKLPTGFEKDSEHTIGWAWEFETVEDGVVDADQDATDTAMGNAADLDDVTFTIKVSATQID